MAPGTRAAATILTAATSLFLAGGTFFVLSERVGQATLSIGDLRREKAEKAAVQELQVRVERSLDQIKAQNLEIQRELGELKGILRATRKVDSGGRPGG